MSDQPLKKTSHRLLKMFSRLLIVMLTLAPNVDAKEIGKTVDILVSGKASSPEKIAAEELLAALSHLYPEDRFKVQTDLSIDSDFQIYLGTPESSPDLVPFVEAEDLVHEEAFVVTTNGEQKGIILGADPRGVMYGVYGLLETLGAGFFLTDDFMPLPKNENFSIKGWELKNRPLVSERIIVSWHSYLGGCTPWDLDEWKDWIRQIQKGGFNTIFLHAYGNNPLITFSYNGIDKEVGHFASTKRGRDWGVIHVNDVRRSIGGHIYEDAIFGSEVTKVPDIERIQATQQLTQESFAYAESRGVKIHFAIDLDTVAANPQAIIETLDEKDRFKVDDKWIVRPDTQAGYEYYKAQAQSILTLYPQIDTLSLWRRKKAGYGSFWPKIKVEDMPESWQIEYRAYIEKNPEVESIPLNVFDFSYSKLFPTWKRAVRELGRDDIEFATGSWRFEWLRSAVEFLPKDVKLVPLDYKCMRKNRGEINHPDFRNTLAEMIEPGRLMPVIWAHHDDGAYVGAPLPFLKNFNDKLTDVGAKGFGIIHWMSHPYDPYFTSHSRQTWALTENEPASDTYSFIAERWFDPENTEVMSKYLDKMMNTMPSFARANTAAFIDHAMSSYKWGKLDEVRSNGAARMALLKSADTKMMTEQQRRKLTFFKQYEQFVLDVFETQTIYENAQQALNEGRLEEGRKLIQSCSPEKIIERYADMVKARGVLSGDKAIVHTMNTRWIPWYLKLRRQLGWEALRLNFGPTSHELLAQGRGYSTFFYDQRGTLWWTLGETETGYFTSMFSNQGEAVTDRHGADWAEEICESGIESSKPISIRLTPRKLDPQKDKSKQGFPPGSYKLTLLFSEPTATGAGQRLMKVELKEGDILQQEVDVFKEAGERNSVVSIDYEISIKGDEVPELLITPLKGKAILCGLVMTPILDD